MRTRAQYVRQVGVDLVLGLLPALVLGIYVRYPALARLPYVALLPWVVMYTDDRRPSVSWIYYFVGAPAAWILMYPASYQFGWFTPLITGLVCSVTWLPFAPLLQRIHRAFRLPRTWTVAVIWVAVEWFRAEFTVAHLDLYRMGVSQARFTHLVQIAEITGVYGLSFLVAAVNGFLADVGFALRDHHGSLRKVWRQRPIVISALSLASLFAAAYVYGLVRVQNVPLDDGPRLAVVQPNTPHAIHNVRGVHLTQLMMSVTEVPAGEVDLIVWPENAVMDDIRAGGPFMEDLGWLARTKGASVVVGAIGLKPELPGRTTNSAFLIGEDGTISGQYDKMVLFPWSEYLPGDETLGRLARRVQRTYRFLVRKGWGYLPTGTRGEEMVVLPLPTEEGTVGFSPLICVENAYPSLPAEAGLDGARFLVNLTSEGEVGGPVQEQLLRICILRAVENRLAYVRAGNTGISAFIDPIGRTQSVLEGENGATIFVPGVLIDSVRLTKPGPTPYARSRDAFAKGLVIVTLVLLVATVWRNRRSRRKAALAAILLAVSCAAPPRPGGDPEGAWRALEAGKRLAADGKAAEALSAYVRACAEPVACRQSLRAIALCFLAAEQPENGADYFAAVAERYPELGAAAGLYRGYMLEKALEAKRAEEAYRDSIETKPTAEAYELLGNFLMRKNDVAGAVGTFRRGARAFPHSDRLRYFLARALLESGDLEESRRRLEGIVADEPDNAAAWTSLGRVHLALDQPTAAAAAFDRAIAVEPENVEARFQLARIALRAGEVEEAYRLLGELRRIEESSGAGPAELR